MHARGCIPFVRRVSALARAMAVDADLRTLADRKTKIVCTIGPASLPHVKAMVYAGMDVARVRAACAEVRNETANHTASKTSAPVRADLRADASVVAIAFDIKGPEIRTGLFDDSVPQGAPGMPKEIVLTRGSTLTLTHDPALAAKGNREMVYIKYPYLTRDLKPGSTIFIDDGNVELQVVSVNSDAQRVTARVLSDAPLGERKGVNLPGVSVCLPTLSAKDDADLRTARDCRADIVFASFVRTAEQVEEIREKAPGMQIISKIEDHEGIKNYDAIVAASDGIMVARGDLGVQIPPERVFLAQKRLVARANVAGKPVICATQMLDSMTKNARPTRAECVDVASAVMDGADAVMLSQETAKGKFPVESVRMMSRICQAAEAVYDHRGFFNALAEMVDTTPHGAAPDSPHGTLRVPAAMRWSPAFVDTDTPDRDRMTAADLETLASAAVHAAMEINAAFIMVVSVTGTTAAFIAKYRPPCPILCMTSDPAVARMLQLRRGLQAVVIPTGMPIAAIKQYTLDMAVALGMAKPGDRVVAVHGQQTLPNQGGVQISLAHVK